MENKARRIAGSALIALTCLLLLASAAAKLAEVPAVVAQMSAAGLSGDRLTFVAALEILSALTFLIPATRSFGLLGISSFLGGAIATHLQHGQPIAPPAIVLVLVWLGAWLRHPSIFWSFPSRAVPRSQVAEGAGVSTRT